MAEFGPFLGLVVAPTIVLEGHATLRRREAWLDRLVGQDNRIYKNAPPGSARSIQDKLLHLAAAREGRETKGQIRVFGLH